MFLHSIHFHLTFINKSYYSHAPPVHALGVNPFLQDCDCLWCFHHTFTMRQFFFLSACNTLSYPVDFRPLNLRSEQIFYAGFGRQAQSSSLGSFHPISLNRLGEEIPPELHSNRIQWFFFSGNQTINNSRFFQPKNYCSF